MFRISKYYLFLVVFVLLLGCSSNSIQMADIKNAFENGQFSAAEEMIREKLSEGKSDSTEVDLLENYSEKMKRLRIEFSEDETSARKKLTVYYPNLSDSLMEVWEKSGDLEMRVIDGEKRYFNRAVSNFFRINKAAKALKDSVDGINSDGVERFQKRYLSALFGNNEVKKTTPFDKHKIQVDYTLTLKSNMVPDGEKVSCWLPFPRPNNPRLSNIELLSVNDDDYILAPETTLQRSLYMEKTAQKDSALRFEISYRFETAALWFDIQPEDVTEYDKTSEIYQKYTLEQPPHIIFSDSIKNLAAKIVGAETNPVSQVKLLYYWINDNIPWAGALEYSVMDCIPEYVMKNGRGDCGMQTFLFMSMARSLGIPCKWQSGWYLLPEEKNLHDWCEVYYNGVGWVPVDVSFKLVNSPDKRIHEFYMNGIDSYRLIVNDGVAQDFVPRKKFVRSEPFDFQRGEVEWKGGNLYFDKWSYHLEVTVLDE